MAYISKTIGQVIDGTSQLAKPERSPSQSQDQVNCIDSQITGKGKRPSSRTIADIGAYGGHDPKEHLVNRDADTRYKVILDNGSIRVVDLEDGSSPAIATPNGLGYLTCSDPISDFRCVTIKDYTFILNRKVVPQEATLPYLNTDRVSAVINFGDGTLIDQGPTTVPGDAQFRVFLTTPFAEYAADNGWVNPINVSFPTSYVHSFSEALAALNGYITSHGGVALSANQFEIGGSINPNPVPDGGSAGTPMAPPAWMAGPTDSIAITPKLGTIITYPYTDGTGVHNFLAQAFIVYTRVSSSTSSDLWPDVGYPGHPYTIPGNEKFGYATFPGSGSVTVSVDGLSWTHQIVNTWTYDMYAAWFASQIAPTLPAGYSCVAAGNLITITAAAGQNLFVSANDSLNDGLVKATYGSLPFPSAVFVVVKQGEPNTTYSVSLNGAVAGTLTTGDVTVTSGPTMYTPSNIATQLATQISAVSGFQAAPYGNVIKIVRADQASFTFATDDSFGNAGMYAMKNRVQSYSDLPQQMIPGYPIEVAGASGAGGLYYHWVNGASSIINTYGLLNQINQQFAQGTITPAGSTWNASEGSNTGIYQECAAPGVPSVLIPTTMPHVLIRHDDGTFTFQAATWFQRVCGDEHSAPSPSFVNKGINKILFHRDRLAFVTKANTFVASRTSGYFNLFPTTVTQVLDTDPIDEIIDHTDGNEPLETATIDVQGAPLIILTKETQHAVTAQGVLNPADITITRTLRSPFSGECEPVSAGPNIYIPWNRGKFTNISRYFLRAGLTAQNTTLNVTAHVTDYIPGIVRKMAYSLTEDTELHKTDDDPNSLYVYKVTWKQDEQSQIYANMGSYGKTTQESWGKWTFWGRVVSMDYVDSDLYLTITDGTRMYLEVMHTHPTYSDDNMGFEVYLDRKVSLTGVYDAGTNRTTWTTPYGFVGLSPVLQVVLGDAWGDQLGTWLCGVDEFGTQVNPSAQQSIGASSCTVSVSGNYSAHPAYVGIGYTQSWELSRFYHRTQQEQAIENSIVTLNTLELNHNSEGKAVAYNVTINPYGRDPEVVQFNSDHFGELPRYQNGVVILDDQSFRFELLAPNDEVTVTVTNGSPYPANFQSMTYEYSFVIPRGSRRM